MDLNGTYTFDAPPARVWDLLMDPAVISACIPGCQGMEPEGEDRYKVKLTVVISDKVQPSSYRLTVEGQGKPGFAKGNSAITLRAEGDKTVVDVSGTVQTGGPIARVGQRLIGGVSKMMLDRFFACLQGKV